MSTPTVDAFRCAAASRRRAEQLAGSATHVRTWVLLEHPGPWGETALLDARLPDGLGAELRRRAADLRAKILLVRRHGARTSEEPGGLRVFAARTHPVAPRLESGLLADPREVLDLDLEALSRGGSSGLATYDGPLLCVCTNGRHDACCAERGRPIAQALAAAHPEATWEVSHIGGDRFAGNMVVLPHGLYYGRLDPDSALAVARAHLAGEVELDHLRGSSHHPMPVQAAEIALRREHGLAGLGDVRVVDHRRDGAVTTVDLAAPDGLHRVRVCSSEVVAEPLTCRAADARPAVHHDVLAIEQLGDGPTAVPAHAEGRP